MNVGDLVRHKTPNGDIDMGIGIVTRVSSTGNVYVMFPMRESPRAMHPGNLEVINETR